MQAATESLEINLQRPAKKIKKLRRSLHIVSFDLQTRYNA